MPSPRVTARSPFRPALVLPILALAPLADAQTPAARPAFRLGCILRQFLHAPALGQPAGSGMARPVPLLAPGLQPARALAPGWPVQPRRTHPRPELKTRSRAASSGTRAQETKVSRPTGQAGAWGGPVHLGTSETNLTEPPRVVLNDGNLGLAVWEQHYQGVNRVFAASWRAEPGRAEGCWQEAACLSGLEEAWGPQVALNAAGAGLATWSSSDGVWAAPFDAGAWGGPVRLAKAGGPPMIGIDATGAALAVWKEGDLRSGWARCLVAARFAPGTGWTEAIKLADGPLSASADLRLAMTPDGKALVTYLDPARATAWARLSDPVHGWGEPVKVAEGQAGNETPSHLEPVLGPGGSARVAWRETITIPVMGAAGAVCREVPILWLHDLQTRKATWLDQGESCRCQLAMDGADRTFAFWHSDLGGLKAARFDDGEPEAVVPLAAREGRGPVRGDFSAAVAPNGMAMAVYGQAAGGSARESTWGQLYLPPEAAGAGGAKPGWQPAVLISSGEGGGIRLPAVAMNDRGVALALWERAVGDGRVRIEAVTWTPDQGPPAASTTPPWISRTRLFSHFPDSSRQIPKPAFTTSSRLTRAMTR